MGEAVPIEVLAVLLVGEDPLARSGLAALLAGEPGLAIVAQSSPAEVSIDPDDGMEALVGSPRVALWDLGLSSDAALDRLEAAVRSGPPVLALVADEELAADAFAAGARGLLFRDAPAESLGDALRAVARGLVVLDPALADTLLPVSEASEDEGEGEPAAASADVEPLTPREVEVLQLLSQGLSNKQIAARLRISDHTAKFHVAAILGKLGAAGRTDAVVRAARAGLILL